MRMLTFSILLFLNVNTRQLPGYIGNGSPFLDAINSQFLPKDCYASRAAPRFGGVHAWQLVRLWPGLASTAQHPLTGGEI